MRQETYRFAFDEAHAELRDITEQYEQLLSRKEQVEKVLAALRPFLEMGGEVAIAEEMPHTIHTPEYKSMLAAQEQADTAIAEFIAAESMHTELNDAFHLTLGAEPVVKPMMEPELEPEPEPALADMSADPFQRRIDDVLRHGVSGRELRIHSRSLNGLLSRA